MEHTIWRYARPRAPSGSTARSSGGALATAVACAYAAAREGSLAVLDGLHRIDPGTLTVIQQLAHDRDAVLNDGTRLLGPERYDAVMADHGFDAAQMDAAGIVRIHPSFRIIGLGEPPESGARPWFTEEIASMFLTHTVSPLSADEERDAAARMYPDLVHDGR